MQEHRGSHAVVTCDNALYAIGGGGMDENLSTCEVLRSGASCWTPIAALGVPRHALAAVALGPTVYAIGGWVAGTACTPAVERYDSAANVWSPCSPLLVARRLHGACLFRDKILVFGGSEEQDRHTHAVECYDPEADTWSPRARLPRAGCTAAAAVGDAVYVFVMGQRVLQYHPLTDSYVKLGRLPLPEWYCFALAALSDRIYVLGGVTKGHWTNAVYVYFPDRDLWEPMPPMRSVRRRCGAAIMLLPATQSVTPPDEETDDVSPPHSTSDMRVPDTVHCDPADPLHQ